MIEESILGCERVSTLIARPLKDLVVPFYWSCGPKATMACWFVVNFPVTHRAPVFHGGNRQPVVQGGVPFGRVGRRRPDVRAEGLAAAGNWALDSVWERKGAS
ncbi:hypothetical protein TNCV_4952401 [Trichonephila clavipes]|nr:hypothetical protein TNCV_4952401 [Trichonephila clavipes]